MQGRPYGFAEVICIHGLADAMMRTTLVALAVLLAGCTQPQNAAEEDESWLALSTATQTAEGAILQAAVLPDTQDLDAARAGQVPRLEIEAVEHVRVFAMWPDGTETEVALDATTLDDEQRVLVLETNETGFVDVRLDWRLRLADGDVVTSETTRWDTHVLRRYQAHASLATSDADDTLTVQLFEVAPGTRGALRYGSGADNTLLRLDDVAEIAAWTFEILDAGGEWQAVDAAPIVRADEGQLVVTFSAPSAVRDARLAFDLVRADGTHVTTYLTDVQVEVRSR